VLRAAEHKFYFAGISGRFFFDKQVRQIRKLIARSIENVDFADALFEGKIGNSSAQAVNTLVYKAGDKSRRFSSLFIVDQLLESGQCKAISENDQEEEGQGAEKDRKEII